MFHHHRQLIALRRSEPALVHGRYALLWPDHATVFGDTRTLGAVQLLVVCNFSAQPVDLPLDSTLHTPDLASAAVLSANWQLPLGLGALCHGGALHLRPCEGLLLRCASA